MAGLLGKAIAGAGAGGSQAMTGLAFPAYLEQQRQEAEKARQETLMQFQHQEGEANRALTQQQITESSRHNVAAEGLTGQQITEAGRHNVATETEAGRHNKASEQAQTEAFKNSGLTTKSTDQGMVVVDQRSGKVTPLMFNGKPLLDLKDNAATVTALSNGARQAIDVGDAEQAKRFLSTLEQMTNRKTGQGGANAVPTPQHITALLSRGNDPAAIAAFDSQFGRGAAQKYLDQAAQKETGSTKQNLQNALGRYQNTLSGRMRTDENTMSPFRTP